MRNILMLINLFVITLVTAGAGYVGTLPDVEAEFAYMKKDRSEKAAAPYSVEQLDKQNENKLNPIPIDDDNYVDIIIKKDKTSAYTNDLIAVVKILEKLRKCINTNQNIQMFNAIVSNLIDNIEYIHTEYKDKPECNYLSYNKLLELSQQARETASFRVKIQAVSKYLPYTSSNNIYTKENLDKKLEELLSCVNDTIFILNNSAE